ncbi:MAG: hypothetical protein HRT47_08240 [Candidatus Caenarcaniphilales bacterium]|nr:hypothetical protein [Candidatus Caenarcaniphilales bacterium]
MIIDSLDFSNNISAVKKSNLRSSNKAAKAYGAQSSARANLGKDSVSISKEAMELSQIDNFSLEQLLAGATA